MKMELYERYIDRIDEIIKAEKISIRMMAEDLQIGNNTINNFLKRKRIINADYFVKICEYVGIDMRSGLNGKREETDAD